MSAHVGHRRTGIELTDILSGTTVRGITWQDTARLWNWALGRGANLIPCNFGDSGNLTANRAFVYKFRVKPRIQTIERLWCVQMRSTGNISTDVEVKVPSSGSAVSVTAFIERNSAMPVTFREVLSAQAASEAEIDIEIKPIDATLAVDSISCWEIPRAILATNNTDRGTDIVTLNSGQPIRETEFANMVAAASDDDQGRRASLIQWAVPVTDNGSTTTSYASNITSTSYVDLWRSGIPILARKLGRTDTTSSVRCKFLAWVSGGDANIRVTDGSTPSAAATISATSPTWSSAIDYAVDCEDMASTDGRQTAASPAWEELQVEVRKNTSGTLYVASVSIWED